MRTKWQLTEQYKVRELGEPDSAHNWRPPAAKWWEGKARGLNFHTRNRAEPMLDRDWLELYWDTDDDWTHEKLWIVNSAVQESNDSYLCVFRVNINDSKLFCKKKFFFFFFFFFSFCTRSIYLSIIAQQNICNDALVQHYISTAIILNL